MVIYEDVDPSGQLLASSVAALHWRCRSMEHHRNNAIRQVWGLAKVVEGWKDFILRSQKTYCEISMVMARDQSTKDFSSQMSVGVYV